MGIKDSIKAVVTTYLKDKDISIDRWDIEIPKDKTNGDYATNISFMLAKEFRKAPPLIAEDIAKELPSYFKDESWLGIEITPCRGFINFRLPVALCYATLQEKNFGKNSTSSKDKILLEYVSANPTGPLHIGHGRWAVLGDCIKRIMDWCGYDVSTEFYVNDAGSQIGNLLNSISAIKQGDPLPENGYAGAYVADLVDLEDPVEAIKDQQKAVLSSLGVAFDKWFSEQDNLHDTNKIADALDSLDTKGHLYKEGPTLFFKSTEFGDDKDRVLIKENGDKTYFAADVAYHYDKANRGYSRLINIWGADHHGYIKRVPAAVHALCGEGVSVEILLGQLVTLFRDGEEVRMSKRTGEMITLEEVIKEIGVDATRFFLIMKSADIHLDFDMELAKKKSNDNPVYYVQYAHARINSILKKSQFKPKFHDHIKLEKNEESLLKLMVMFEKEVTHVAQKCEPYRLAHYLLDLSNSFHSFYHSCRVNVEDQNVSENRLALISSVKDVIALGLSLLGINAPDSM